MRQIEAHARGGYDHLRFHRSSSDRLVAGVAGGLAHRTEADSYVVRLCFVLLGLAGGAGLVLYAVAWLLSDGEEDDQATVVRPERSLAVASLTAAALVVLRSFGIWPGDALMLCASIVAAGSALVWHTPRTKADGQPAAAAGTGVNGGGAGPFDRLLTGRPSAARIAGGLVLTAIGLVTLTADGHLGSVPRSAAALGLALAGMALVLGPYAGRLIADQRAAERERIRTEERAEIAAQLHDSVLQTLALMQRSADDPRRMVLLARRQERSLRQWLYGGRAAAPAQTLAEHAEAMAAEIELDHDVPVELVVVGDEPVDEAAVALLGAVREAAVNAAKHAGADEVDVYVEVCPSSVVAFVRDKGGGFDPNALPADRHGIEASIRARIARVGGRSRLDTAPGAGTEWELEVPR
jgi:signal transduction histidine kinase